MKAQVRCILTVIISALAGFHAEAATADTGNPYAKIAVRNAFGLKDPPPVTEQKPETPPPPKITLQGIAKVLGRKQVLFKVAMPAKPPQPATEVSKIIAEGDSEDEIEVLAIDEVAGVIKFKNHGTPETKTLKDDAAKPSPGSMALAVSPGAVPQPTPATGGAVMPMPSPSQGGGGASLTTIGSSRAAGLQAIPSRDRRGGYGLPTASASGALGQAGTAPAINQSPEESVIKVEIERELHKDAISTGRYPPPPPTPITPQPAPKTTPQ